MGLVLIFVVLRFILGGVIGVENLLKQGSGLGQILIF